MDLKVENENSMVNHSAIPNWQIFIFLAILNFLIAFWAYHLIFNREFYYTLLSEQMTIARIDRMIDLFKRYAYLGIMFIPLVLFFKFMINALLLQLILLLKFIEIEFSRLLRLVMLASLTLAAGQIFNYIRIYLWPIEKITYKSLMVKPFSFAAFLESDLYPPSSVYVLNQCNIFEILWVASLSYGFIKTHRIENTDAVMVPFLAWSLSLFLVWAVYFFIEKLH